MIRVALVGAGVMGSVHGRNFTTFGDRARVSRVYDPDSAKASSLAEELGAYSASSLEEAVSGQDVDAVAISIPPTSHRGVVELALGYDKNVFLEKPVATTRQQAEAIVELARASKRRVMIGHVLRFWPGYPQLRDLVIKGTLGRPSSMSCLRIQPPPSTTGWLADVEVTGGIAPLILIHDFDLMNWVFGSPKAVQSIALRGEGISSTHVVVGVDYDGGRGAVEGSVSLPTSHPFSTRTSVYCEDGSVHFGYDVAAVLGTSQRDASQFTPASEPVITIYRNDGKPGEIVAVPGSNPWRPELGHFLSCIENDQPIENGTPSQALEALEVALAANESLIEGNKVPI